MHDFDQPVSNDMYKNQHAMLACFGLVMMQLVLYPILNLRNHRCDLHWYLRMLEGIAIDVLREVSGLKGERIKGLTGVWVGGYKLAAIGVRATM